MDKRRPLDGRVSHPLVLVLVSFVLCLVGAQGTPAAAQERFRPADSAVLLHASGLTQGERQASLRTLDRAWRAQPQDLNRALAYARAVFNLGLKEGDMRWFGSAKAALAPWWQATDLPPEAHFLRGLVKQGFHDFDGGLKDFERAIVLEPRRAEFWSWRFALRLLQADMAGARQDTEEIAKLFGPDEADIYRAILAYRTGQPLAAIKTLRRVIQSPGHQDASSQDWLGFHLGEAHRVAGQPEQAVAVWGERLKASGQSHLIRLSLADLLNQQGRHLLAKNVAMHRPDMGSLTDALLVQALLASRGLKDGDESRLARLMDARLKAQALRQESLIERPKLIYQITYGQDLAAGLALSIENWRLQKEPLDAILFVQAALALGQARAAEPVVEWAEQTGYTDPQLSALMQQLKAHASWTGRRS
jgi:hypothetical protein